ncbi:MAG: DNA polymerase I, partial [Firmicutes bacterium]|nr:DNA polymerase I [Bacillota bacterium]
ETASKVFGVPLEEVTPQLRSNAKAVNFGVIYGMSGFGLAEELTISRKQAEQYIKDYFNRFKGVKAFMDKSVEQAKQSGSVRTLYGRKRAIPEILSGQYMVRQLGERLAMNSPIQGTAADIIKIAMIKVFKALEEAYPQSRMILQVHDELIIQARKEDAEGVGRLLKECMESAAELKVKLIAEENTADNWYDLK